MFTSTKSLSRKIAHDKRGGVAPLFGLMAMPMLFAVGLSIDQARLMQVKEKMQAALDAAALAAMANDAENVDAFGQKYFSANFDDSLVVSKTVHFTKTENGEVNATASASVATTAAALIGYSTVQVEVDSIIEPQHEVTAEETSETVVPGATPCLHVMDQNGTGFTISDNEHLDASTCVVKVRSNHSSAAMLEEDSTDVKFKKIYVKGQATVSNGLLIMDSPHTVTEDAAVVGNPYESSITDVVQNVSIGSCTTTNTNKKWTGNVSPGTYCGTTIFEDATFAAGVYIIKGYNGNIGSSCSTSSSGNGNGNNKSGNGNGNGNSSSGSSSSSSSCTSSNSTSTTALAGTDGRLLLQGLLDGSAGVTFYLADNKTQLHTYETDEGTVLTAPTTGTTRGILMFEDSNRGANWSVDIDTCHDNSWTGLVYLPSANMRMNIDEWPTFNVSMSVNQLDLDQVEEIEWLPYAWTPFNKSTSVKYEDETETTTTTTTTVSDIYIKD
jgi:Flp pilus assembly protein TadG